MGIISSLLIALLGVVFVIWPGTVAGSLVQIVGILLIAAGLLSVLTYRNNRSSLLLVSIIIEILLGVLFLCAPKWILSCFFIVIGIFVTIAGVGELVRLIKASYVVKASWKYLLLPALVVACGLFLIFYPKAVTDIVVLFLGITLIIYGISELVTAIKLRKLTA